MSNPIALDWAAADFVDRYLDELVAGNVVMLEIAGDALALLERTIGKREMTWKDLWNSEELTREPGLSLFYNNAIARAGITATADVVRARGLLRIAVHRTGPFVIPYPVPRRYEPAPRERTYPSPSELPLPDDHVRALENEDDPVHELLLARAGPRSIVRKNKRLRFSASPWPPYLVAFAEDGCGGYYGYDLRTSPPRIVHVDHELPVTEQNFDELAFPTFAAWRAYTIKISRRVIADLLRKEKSAKTPSPGRKALKLKLKKLQKLG